MINRLDPFGSYSKSFQTRLRTNINKLHPLGHLEALGRSTARCLDPFVAYIGFKCGRGLLGQHLGTSFSPGKPQVELTSR